MSKLILSYLFKTNLSAFRSAILNDDTDKICRMLDIERDYIHKIIDGEGNTALILAIKHASPLTVRLLLEQGASPDQINELTSQTPLGILASKVYANDHSSKAKKALEMAKILLDHGAYIDKPSLRVYTDENNKDYPAKETPLIAAVRKRNLPIAKLLIERKANVNYIERRSQVRAIHFAITNGDETMYDLLENAGALASSIVTIGDHTLLHWFCYKKENDKKIDLLNKLLDKGCNINAENWEKRTPLMIAAKNNMIETCRILLKNRAVIDKRDANGNQAIDLTIPGSECSQLLLQKGHIDSSPPKKIIWRKRIESTRRNTSESSSSINTDDETSGHHSSRKCSDDEETNGIPHPYIYPIQRRESEEFDKKYDRIWEKFVHTTPKRKVLKKFYKPRTHSADSQDKSSM